MRSFSIQSICLYIIILFIPNILLSQEICNTYFLKDLSFKSIIEPQFTLVTKQNEVLSCGNIKYGPIYNSFISKFSENGDLLWNYQLVNTKNETLSGGIEVSNNNFIVYGNIENKIILHKIDNLGRIIWSKEVSTPNSIKDSLTKLIVNKDGTIFGCLNSKTDTEKSLPVIIKIDVDGNTLWTKMLIQNESAFVNTVADDYPNILVGGSRIIDKTRTPFVAKIDNSGNLIESKNIRLTSLVDHYNSNIESEITEIIVKDTSIAYLFHYLGNICIAEFTKADDRLIFEFTLGSSSSQSFSSLKYYDNNFLSVPLFRQQFSIK